MSHDQKEKPTAFQKLLNEPKGKVKYKSGEAFLLHVFWECPNPAAAKKLLEGLKQCSDATQVNTPCTPTYFFRFSHNDFDIYGEAPKYVKDHKQLSAAIKKLQVGISPGAVSADLSRRGIDAKYLELNLMDELPLLLQNEKPVAVEFTELYLDERAFMEHSGSRDYLNGYGIVMSPGMSNSNPTTLRIGTPSLNVVEKILDPILREKVVNVPEQCKIWRQPPSVSETSVMISIDVDQSEALILSENFQDSCVWNIFFEHPIRKNVKRFIAVFSEFPKDEFLNEIKSLKPLRGEFHAPKANFDQLTSMKKSLKEKDLDFIKVNHTESVGYVLHEKASVLMAE